MLIQFRHARRLVNLEQAKKHLTDTVIEIFTDRPRIDLLLAIGAGHRAIERGTPFFEAVEIAEGVLMVWTEAVERMHEALIAQRNRERLTEYRIRRTGLDLFQVAVKHAKCGAGISRAR